MVCTVRVVCHIAVDGPGSELSQEERPGRRFGAESSSRPCRVAGGSHCPGTGDPDALSLQASLFKFSHSAMLLHLKVVHEWLLL